MGAVNLSKKTVNLSKGEKINLSKQTDGLKRVMIGLGWDPADKSYEESKVTQPGFLGRLFGKKGVHTRVPSLNIDCDAWLALLQNGKLKSDNDIIYYGHKEFYNCGDLVVKHHGDNLTGEGDGDDEEITIDLSKMPSWYDSIVIGITIYQGHEKGQSFGNIKNTFVRVVDEKDGFEICRFNQEEMAENKDALTFIAGKLYKDKDEWKFIAIGKCTMDKTIRNAANHYRYD